MLDILPTAFVTVRLILTICGNSLGFAGLPLYTWGTGTEVIGG